jgi:prepilin-type N-terminal cleavage/methylation domain-containing protein
MHSKDIMKAKTHLSQNKSRGGFTLVEMLVVIGMIAALAGISFPVYNNIQKKVEKQQVSMDFQAITRAVDNFELEYNYLPAAGGPLYGGDEIYNGETTNDVTDFITILVGAENTVNFKSIRFLECREAKPEGGGFVSGLHENNDGTYSFYTAWGSEFSRLVLDTNYDGKMTYIYGVGELDAVGGARYWYADKGPDGQWYGYGGTVNDDLTSYDELRPQ